MTILFQCTKSVKIQNLQHVIREDDDKLTTMRHYMTSGILNSGTDQCPCGDPGYTCIYVVSTGSLASRYKAT